MGIKTRKKIILTGFTVLIAVSIIVFTLSSFIIARKSNDAISQVGEVYTHAMAEQLQQTFDAIISMQVFQVQGIVERTPPGSIADRQELISELTESGRVRNFSYLALYTDDGEREIIYGDPLDYYSENTFFTVLKNSSQRVFSGYNSNDENVMSADRCCISHGKWPDQFRYGCRITHELSGNRFILK